ncbi:MAG: hypothetical protein JWR26_5008 [Pedosphaera sp.]|nr:hypothetical protein [Pedosphaera sp.]
MLQTVFRCFIPSLALVLLTGCLSPQNKVARELPALHHRWQADVARQSALPERALAWPEALALLQQNNLKLRAARVDITNSQELARQVFRDLIPTINLRSGLSESLKNLPAASINDVTFNIDSFFNIPGVVNFNTRIFAGRLSVLRAQTAFQLAVREQTIDLFKLFLEAGENEEVAAELRSDHLLADAVRKSDELSGQIMLKDIKTRQLALVNAQDDLQTRIGQLLMDQQFRWKLTTNGLPAFTYPDRPLCLSDTNRVAQLQTKLVALELVGAWAQIQGIKLQYWPELTIFVTGPSVFQRVDGKDHFWSSADVIASADFFWALDTRGYVSQQLRLTRRAQDLERAQLLQDSRSLVDRLLSAQRLVGSLTDQIKQLDQLISFLDEIPRDMDLNSILQAAETNRTLRSQRFKLRRDLAELNTLFWFVDEQQWPG